MLNAGVDIAVWATGQPSGTFEQRLHLARADDLDFDVIAQL
ncbi:hypothetical protein [Streptomyces sp. NPDC088847]